MKAKTASLAAAAVALAAGPALAAPSFEGPAVPVASSYADLLTPIPNASERLRAADAEDMAAAQPELIQVQNHHHHHHHHHHSRHWYLTHGYVWLHGAWVLRPPHHHHHHHHHV